MSFEIAPNASLYAYSIPTDLTSTNKTSWGIERFMHATNADNGQMVWSSWNTSMASPNAWDISPTNNQGAASAPENHLFEYITYSRGQRRIYTTGKNRVVNSTYPTNKISYANYTDFRTSETVFPNIAFTKSSGSFPTAIYPKGIACNYEGNRILVLGFYGTTTYVMASADFGNSWFSIPVPASLSTYATDGGIQCDGNYFYVLTSTLHKITVDFNSSMTESAWTEIDFVTSSSKPAYVSGYSNLRIFDTDALNGKLYAFTYNNSNSTEGQGSGIFVSTDTVNWTLVRFTTLSPSRLVTYISDVSFGNRFGNKLVVTANYNQWNDNNNRYIYYTSDLTGKTGWTSVEPSVIDKRNYYEIISTCITPDNRYYVFDRLGSIYYTSDLSGTFTKVATGASPPYDNRVYYIDGSEYTKTYYGNATYGTEGVQYGGSLYSDYASDTFKGSDSYSSRAWAKQNLTFTSADDGYSNEAISIGFDWNYNGSTYNSFRLNTNGQLQFSNFDGSVSPTTGDKILANFGDLWMDQTLVNTTNPNIYGQITTATAVTPAALASTYKITASQSGSAILFSLVTASDLNNQCAKYLKINGYTTLGGYVSISAEGLVDFEGFTAYSGTSLSQILSFDITYCDSYTSYYKTYYPNSFWTYLLNNNKHGVFTRNISWVDNGVQHNIFRMTVNCGQYASAQKDCGYRVSLYKAGASQKISISALSVFSNIAWPKGHTSSKVCGPYPAAATNTTIKAPIDYTETTWYSDNNGVTWYLNSKDNTNKSTVVQMGPPRGVSTNVSLNTTKNYLNKNRTNQYSATNSWSTDIRSTTFGYPYTDRITIGSNMATMIMNTIVQNVPTNQYEVDLYNAFNAQYGVEINKDTFVYYKYGDIDRSGAIDLSDSIDMLRINGGLTPNGSYSLSGAYRLVEYLLTNYSNDFITYAYNAGWIAPRTTQMSSLFDSNTLLPGIKNLTSSMSNLRSSHLIELGPVYRGNVNDKFTFPAPAYKSTYITATSTRIFAV